MATKKKTYTTRQLADHLGTLEWRIRRLFEDQTIAEPPRFAGKRMIPEKLIPVIKEALIQREWLQALPVDVEKNILGIEETPNDPTQIALPQQLSN